MRRTTVVLPDPEPPATPMTIGPMPGGHDSTPLAGSGRALAHHLR